MNNYENQIIDAIETIVENSISKAGYDKTIKASIIRILDINSGKYLLKYQDSTFEAYTSDLSINYEKDNIVFVLIPEGDMRKDKTILGKVGGNTLKESVITITNKNLFEANGINCIKDNSSFELCSYKESESKILYDINENINIIKLNQVDAKEYLNNSQYLIIGADIKTNLSIDQRLKGNYGIIFKLMFKDEKNEEVLKTYILDINNLIGNPYRLDEKTPQLISFNISDNFLYVQQISIFEKDFPNIDNNKPNDIFISNIQLYGGNKISEEEYENNRLIFSTPQGNYFTVEDLPTSEKNIIASIKMKDEIVNLSKSNVEYYWFKQNLSVTTDSEKYNFYGGEGWECLNEFKNNSWQSSSNILKITKEDVTFNQNEYKCIIVIDENRIENSIIIKNYAADVSISIISDSGQQYYYDYGYPSLICLVNGEDRDTNEYSYYWSVVDNNEQYTKLDETTESNLEYENAVAAYNQLLLDIKEEKIFESDVKNELERLEKIIEKYNYTQRVERNKIYKINVNTINDYSIYKCNVFYREKNLGVITYTIYNQKTEIQNNYTLDIINENQIFKYNENGISPASESLTNPIEIKPLTFKIYDNNGLELDDLAKASCQIEWIPPKENTMIITDDTYNEEYLNYTIQDIYDNQKVNNTIELKVKYKQFIMSAFINLIFIKEGENGTNGTEYVCRIVPNTDQDIQYPYIINKNINYIPKIPDKWFNVQLWKNGIKIFENFLSGNSTENRRVTVKWEILKNKYSAKYRDESNFLVTTDGSFTYQELNTDNGQSDPANIIKCSIKYNDSEYYAMLPIPIINIYDDNYKIDWKRNSGFNYVEYSSNGLNPKYNNFPFELTVLEKINNVWENISNLNASHSVGYMWKIRGEIFNLQKKEWEKKELFYEDGSTPTTRCQIMFRPLDSYNGECVSTAIECSCVNIENREIGKIYIPIYMYLNRYNNPAINGWDGNSIEIKEDEGYILTPQIGSGRKEQDNSFTGMIMGESKDGNSNVSKIGLLGYNSGEQTMFLDAESGGAIFGRNNKGQILIDPKSEKSLLYSHNYWKESNYDEKGFPIETDDTKEKNITGEGLLIDLSSPKIKYGDGSKFQVDENGNVTCGKLISEKGVLSLLQIPFEKHSIGLTTTTLEQTKYKNYSYETKIGYTGVYNFTHISIPDNFTVVKVECLLVSESSIGVANVAENIGLNETYKNFPSFVWNIVSALNQGEFHNVPFDNLSVYYAEDSAFESTSGVKPSTDIFYTGQKLNFDKCIKLKKFNSNFIDLDTNGYAGNYYGKNQSLQLDITNEIKNLINEKGKDFYLSIAPTTFPTPKNISWSFRDISSYEFVATPSTPLTTIYVDAEHRQGICYVGYYIYGYYDV